MGGEPLIEALAVGEQGCHFAARNMAIGEISNYPPRDIPAISSTLSRCLENIYRESYRRHGPEYISSILSLGLR